MGVLTPVETDRSCVLGGNSKAHFSWTKAMWRSNNSLVIKPLESDIVKLAEVNILQEDLLKINTKVDECLKQGSTFDEETFGISRDELIRWRTLVNEKKSFLSHKEVEERKENSARTEMHLKGKKVDWPGTITQALEERTSLHCW